MGIYQRVLSVYFRRHDVSLAAIGLLSALALAWSVKALWSPLVERFGARQDWIAPRCSPMTAALVAVALLPVNPIGSRALVRARAVLHRVGDAGHRDRRLHDRARRPRRRGARQRRAHHRLSRRPDRVRQRAAAAARPDRLEPDVLSPAAVASRSRPALRLTPPIALPPPAERKPLRALRAGCARPGVAAVVGVRAALPDRRPRDGADAAHVLGRPRLQQRGVRHCSRTCSATCATSPARVAGGWWAARAGSPPALWGTGALALPRTSSTRPPRRGPRADASACTSRRCSSPRPAAPSASPSSPS